MTEVRAVSDGIAQIADSAAEAGVVVAHAALAAEAGTAALAATFGLLGTEFALAFGTAQSRHAAAAGELSAVFDSIAAAARVSSASYSAGDADTARSLTNGLA